MIILLDPKYRYIIDFSLLRLNLKWDTHMK